MKKVKIIVSSFVVVAIVGSALAFKARTHVSYYTKKDPITGFCTVLTNTLNITIDLSQPSIPISTTNNEPCINHHVSIQEY